MPVDKMMLDAMLGTFRNMMKECRDKNMSGHDFNQMELTMKRMEELGQELSDIGAYSGQLMQEGLFMKFSDHYGKLLSAAAQQSAIPVSAVYDEAADKALLQQTIRAYKDAIISLKENKAQTKKMLGVHSTDADVLIKDKSIIEAIENVINLGESGISYPEFLAEMMKRGLDKAMDGIVLARDGQVYILEAAQALSASPGYIKKEEDKLILFDALSNASAAKVPNSLQYTLGCEKIEWSHQPAINKWNKIKEGWEKAAFWLDEWMTSYCSFAPFIAPWAQARNPQEAVIESKDCVPGKLRVWEKINQQYFNLSLIELFRHESFAWDVQHQWMYWSQEYMEFLLKEVEPVCKPFQNPSAEMIAAATSFYNEKRKLSPAIGEPALRYAKYFDNYFGTGEYVKRFGMPEKVETNASPWEFEKFSY